MEQNRKVWWKIYLWLMVVLLVVVVGFDVYDKNPPSAIDILDYLTWIFSLVGVFGFAYNRAILSQDLWRVWLPVVIAWDVWIAAREYYSEPIDLDLVTLVILSIIIGALALPEYVALFFYGYRSQQIWKTSTRIYSGE